MEKSDLREAAKLYNQQTHMQSTVSHSLGSNNLSVEALRLNRIKA
jgi:hypothetical protein